jgi:putative transposase
MKYLHRRNLPHLYFNSGIYFITSRLANSIPQKALAELNQGLKNNDKGENNRVFNKYDALLDSGNFGIKHLFNSRCADIVKYTLQFPNGKDYKLICYCIMPNHFHLVFELLLNNRRISKIMQSIKRISATECNLILNRKGRFWQDESYDRLVRDEKELYFVIRYVLLNPVKAGLVKKWDDWKYTYCHPDYLVI